MSNKSKSFLKTTVTALGILHCINKVIDSVSITNSSVKTSGKYYHWKQGDIFYRIYGSGTPLLLIHDLTAYSSHHEWDEIVDNLAKNHTVYVLDLIGCGKSDKPAVTYTNYLYVQLITDFIHDVICGETDVIATGLSASFVLMANHMNKDLFSAITFVNPKPISYLKEVPDERSKVLLKLFELPIIGKTLYYIVTSKNAVSDYLTEDCYYNPFSVKESVSKSYYDASHAANGNGKFLFASEKGKYLNADISNALKSAGMITIANGEHYANRAAVEHEYALLNPFLVFETVSGTKLLPQLEDAASFSSFFA